jgi:two-component system, NarL family, sensor kinase
MRAELFEVFLIIAGTTGIVLALLVVLIYSLLTYQKKRFAYQRNLLIMQMETQQQTFKDVSRELHDNVGALLSIAVANLKSVLAGKPITNVTTTVDLLEESIALLRDISVSVDPEKIASKNLRTLVEEEITRVKKLKLHDLTLQYEGSEKLIVPFIKLVVLRLVQESLNNCVKHAQASAIRVAITLDTDYLALTVEDNGKGMDDTKETGHGLKNMRERASIIGASLTILGNNGNGLKIMFVYPFKNNSSLPAFNLYRV